VSETSTDAPRARDLPAAPRGPAAVAAALVGADGGPAEPVRDAAPAGGPAEAGQPSAVAGAHALGTTTPGGFADAGQPSAAVGRRALGTAPTGGPAEVTGPSAVAGPHAPGTAPTGGPAEAGQPSAVADLHALGTAPTGEPAEATDPSAEADPHAPGTVAGPSGEPAAEAQSSQLDGPPPPAPLGVDRAPTGNVEVDAAAERLADADELPTEDHIEVYEDVHAALREILSALDRPAGPRPPQPRGPLQNRS
jgi:hypothetical protein